MILWSQCYRTDACATQYEFIVVNGNDFCISQGSVATRLRWGGIFINYFIANFQL